MKQIFPSSFGWTQVIKKTNLPKAKTFCFLYQCPFMMTVPYTRTSLKRKKAFSSCFLRPCFLNFPSPIRTRPGTDKDIPDGPKEFSTFRIRLRLSSSVKSWFILQICCLLSEQGLYCSCSQSAALFKESCFLLREWDFPGAVCKPRSLTRKPNNTTKVQSSISHHQ